MGIELRPARTKHTTMKTLNLLLAITGSALLSSCSAQIKNTRTISLRIDGDCSMCEKRIEDAGNVKGEAQVNWDPDTKQATIAFDSTRTNLDAILKRISLAGYDTPNYLAPDAAYAQLPGCCQYERTMKHAAMPAKDGATPAEGTASAPMDEHAMHHEHDAEAVHEDHDHGEMHQHGEHSEQPAPSGNDPIGTVLADYFALKDALVASNAKLAMKNAETLNGAMHGVNVEKLPKELQATWTEVMQAVMPNLHPLADSGDLDQQRALFAKLTEPMAKLVAAAPQKEPIYLDHCPMFNGGSDWLSKDQAIKNPFYGSMMLGCGSVTMTIQ